MQEQLVLFIESIIKDGLIVVAGIFVLGQIIKGLKIIDPDYIPMIGGLFGALLGIGIPHIFPDSGVIVCAVKGLICGWAATGGFETFKNAVRVKDEA